MVCLSYQEGVGSSDHLVQRKVHKVPSMVVGWQGRDLHELIGRVEWDQICYEVFCSNPEPGNIAWVVDGIIFVQEPYYMQEQEVIEWPKGQIVEKSHWSVLLSLSLSDLNFSSCVIHETYTCLSLPLPPYTTLMAPRKQNDTEPQRELEPKSCHPYTRQKNATQHPRIEVEKRLWVQRDPAVIQQEKDVWKKKKEERECAA